MNVTRVAMALLSLTVVCSCSGGGGGGSTTGPLSPWEKFRHDLSNSGAASGAVGSNPGMNQWMVQVDEGTPARITGSPVIDIDGTVYVGSEGSTFAAVEASGTVRWRVTTCSICPPGQQDLGTLISSPGVYTLSPTTSLFIGSGFKDQERGGLFAFEAVGTAPPTCTVCFRPRGADFSSNAVVRSAAFVSSPSFTVNPVTLTVAGTFIGAQVTIEQAGTTRSVGKLYAVNSDGTVRWQFPLPGDPADLGGAITSSPALGIADAVYFTAADDNLYALAADGTLKWKFRIATAGERSDPRVPFTASPLSANVVYTGTAAGEITAVNPDGTFRWRVPAPDGDVSGFAASLAFGRQALMTPTDTPSPTPTPTGSRAIMPTATPTPLLSLDRLFGVTRSGRVLVIDVDQAAPVAEPVPVAVPLDPGAAVLSSPALSSDGYLVFGDTTGKLHAVNTATGVEPDGWPVVLTDQPIRSSPSIGGDGTVYVGADDGMLYAVGGTPVPTPTATPALP